MSELVITPGAVLTETLDTGQTATVAALVGVIGAVVSLYGANLHGLPLFFLAASLPMSVLGLALGIRHRNHVAWFLGTTGVVFAGLGLTLA